MSVKYQYDYIIGTQAWYHREEYGDEIDVRRSAISEGEHSGAMWEFSIAFGKFENVGGGRSWAQVRIYHDAWMAFKDLTVRRLFSRLAALGDAYSKEDVIRTLNECGFIDVTERVRVA